MKNKKNIRIAFKNIEEEDDIAKDDINKTTDINIGKKSSLSNMVDSLDNINNDNKVSKKKNFS
jgi:hypothetical protein